MNFALFITVCVALCNGHSYDHADGIADGSDYYLTVSPHVLLIGGWDSSTLFSDVEVFPEYGCTFPDLPAERWGHMATLFEKHFFVCGGFNEVFQPQSDCWSLDLSKVSEWKKEPSLLTPISTGSMAAQSGILYVMGGDDGVSTTNKAVQSFVFGDSHWKEHSVDLTEARMGTCALTSDDWVVITGGSPTYRVAQRSHMHDQEWIDLATLNEPERMFHGCMQAMLGPKQMYIVVAGGENSAHEAVRTVERIFWDDVMNSVWEYVSELPMDHRSSPGLFDSKGGALIVGGWHDNVDSAVLKHDSQEWEVTDDKLKKGRWGSANIAVLSPSIDPYCQ